jgi:carbonic anhydrase
MYVPQELLDGYGSFRSERFAHEAARYKSLAEGQQPKTMVIGCADSRVDPATIFSAGPGELFIVRNVAAIVPPCEQDGSHHGTSAALEFAVAELQVENIVVLGHGMCGGVAAALATADDRPVGQFIKPWVDLISNIRDEVLQRTEVSLVETRQTTLERMAVQQSLDNLMTFPFVTAAVNDRHLTLSGAWFSIAEGELYWLDSDTDVFELVPN